MGKKLSKAKTLGKTADGYDLAYPGGIVARRYPCKPEPYLPYKGKVYKMSFGVELAVDASACAEPCVLCGVPLGGARLTVYSLDCSEEKGSLVHLGCGVAKACALLVGLDDVSGRFWKRAAASEAELKSYTQEEAARRLSAGEGEAA